MCVLVQAMHQIDELLPAAAVKIPYDDVIAAALLVYFGVKTLKVGGSWVGQMQLSRGMLRNAFASLLL